MQKNRSKGFTLIELLVVIAIIGILSAVVLASLNTARTKGSDAAVKSNLDTIRTQSALYYDTNTGYSVLGTTIAAANATLAACATASSIFVDPNVAAAISAADKAAGGAGAATPTKVLCSIGGATATSQSSTWAAYTPMLGGGGWCVDSNGKSASSTALTAATCP